MNESSQEAVEVTPSLGHVLAQGRAKAGLSLDEVAARLKLTPSQITKLEQDDYTSLGATTFIKGYIKAYCGLLELNQDEVLALFQAPVEHASKNTMQSFSRRTEKEAHDNRLMLVSYVILALVLGSSGFMLWQTSSSESEVVTSNLPSDSVETPPQARSQAQLQQAEPNVKTTLPVVTNAVQSSTEEGNQTPLTAEAAPEPESQAQTLAQTPQSKTQNTVIMHFKDDSWVEIFDATAERVAFGVKKAGYTMTVQGVAPFSVVLGKHQVVEVKLDGQDIDLSSLPRNRLAKFKLPLVE